MEGQQKNVGHVCTVRLLRDCGLAQSEEALKSLSEAQFLLPWNEDGVLEGIDGHARVRDAL